MGLQIISMVLESTRHQSASRDEPSDWPENVTGEREQRSGPEEDFAHFQPYLAELVIEMSCLLCPHCSLMLRGFLQLPTCSLTSAAAEELQGECG